MTSSPVDNHHGATVIRFEDEEEEDSSEDSKDDSKTKTRMLLDKVRFLRASSTEGDSEDTSSNDLDNGVAGSTARVVSTRIGGGRGAGNGDEEEDEDEEEDQDPCPVRGCKIGGRRKKKHKHKKEKVRFYFLKCGKITCFFLLQS